jgi:hypothetical protein
LTRSNCIVIRGGGHVLPPRQLKGGREPIYEIRPRSLVETYAAKFGEGPSVRMRQAESASGEA